MLKRIMASFGVGAAKVDLILERRQYRIGETVRGKAVIVGGGVDQAVSSLDVDVMLRFSVRGKEFSRAVQTVKVCRDILVKAKKNIEFPFEHHLPADYPVSKGPVSYHLVTKMDIARAVDAGDADSLVVLPGREMEMVFEALDILGFKEKIGSGRIERYGQEFVYYPGADFDGRLKELSFKFLSRDGEIKLFMELRLGGGLTGPWAAHHAELAMSSEMFKESAAGRIAGRIKEFIETECMLASQNGPRPAPDLAAYHRHPSGRHGFGGFAGGMVAGLLGAMMLHSLFDGGGDEMAAGDPAEGDAGGDDGFDFGFGDLGDDI